MTTAYDRDPYIQSLRGLAIAAVVLIHCLPGGPVGIILRPALNWAVALFLFLSGMLTSKNNHTDKFLRGIWRKRILKVVGPYCVWSALYILLSGRESIIGLMKDLLTGGAAPQMYYLLVYAQLMLLTPLLIKHLETKRIFLYSVTPVVLVIWELVGLLRIDVPNIAVLFSSWLVYYLFGLEWPRWRRLLWGRERLLGSVFASFLIIQMFEGFFWHAFGDYNMATTQLRLTNMIMCLAAISRLMLASESSKRTMSDNRMLTLVGDCSFGIYLLHYAIITIIGINLIGVSDSYLVVLAQWTGATSISMLVVLAFRRALPLELLRVIGFA